MYSSVSQLPQSIRSVLPIPAQDVYKNAFNSAFEQYRSPADRRDEHTREASAHRVAWAAVRHVYTEAHDGKWHKKK